MQVEMKMRNENYNYIIMQVDMKMRDENYNYK